MIKRLAELRPHFNKFIESVKERHALGKLHTLKVKPCTRNPQMYYTAIFRATQKTLEFSFDGKSYYNHELDHVLVFDDSNESESTPLREHNFLSELDGFHTAFGTGKRFRIDHFVGKLIHHMERAEKCLKEASDSGRQNTADLNTLAGTLLAALQDDEFPTDARDYFAHGVEIPKDFADSKRIFTEHGSLVKTKLAKDETKGEYVTSEFLENPYIPSPSKTTMVTKPAQVKSREQSPKKSVRDQKIDGPHFKRNPEIKAESRPITNSTSTANNTFGNPLDFFALPGFPLNTNQRPQQPAWCSIDDKSLTISEVIEACFKDEFPKLNPEGCNPFELPQKHASSGSLKTNGGECLNEKHEDVKASKGDDQGVDGSFNHTEVPVESSKKTALLNDCDNHGQSFALHPKIEDIETNALNLADTFGVLDEFKTSNIATVNDFPFGNTSGNEPSDETINSGAKPRLFVTSSGQIVSEHDMPSPKAGDTAGEDSAQDQTRNQNNKSPDNESNDDRNVEHSVADSESDNKVTKNLKVDEHIDTDDKFPKHSPVSNPNSDDKIAVPRRGKYTSKRSALMASPSDNSLKKRSMEEFKAGCKMNDWPNFSDENGRSQESFEWRQSIRKRVSTYTLIRPGERDGIVAELTVDREFVTVETREDGAMTLTIKFK
jgi:hypothetical protein